jgi:hypothetical protein
MLCPNRVGCAWQTTILDEGARMLLRIRTLVAITISILVIHPSSSSAKSQHLVPARVTPQQHAYPGVLYEANVHLNCDPNCANYEISPNKLSDGTTPDASALKIGELKFTSSSKLTGTQILTLTAYDARGAESAAILTILVDANSFTANPHGSPPTGAQKDSAIQLPDITLAESYSTSISLGVQCTSPITLTGVGGDLPPGLLATSAASPNLKIDATGAGLAAGTYPFTAACSDAGGSTMAFFTVKVLGAPQPVDTNTSSSTNAYDDPCQYQFNDCDWAYTVAGGGELSALSSQDTETNPFVVLFARTPKNVRGGNAWVLARFLGAANANNTNNVVSAFTTATGSSSSSGLPQVGTAIDYAIGYEYDWFHPGWQNPGSGQFTLGAIVAFGATTPLSAQHATTAYVVPAWGTNECSELIQRFPTNMAAPGLPATGLPAQPTSPYITTTVTPTSGPPTMTTTGPFCIINNQPTTTTSSTGTTVVSGTAQTDIAFAPEDRNSFLLKYMVGLRLISREIAPNTQKCGPSSGAAVGGSCSRDIVDITVGQDQAVTGGLLRHFVAKTDATFPIPVMTSVYFFGSAAIRFTRNKNLSPLILQPATIVAASPTPPATITIPSGTTWVLPLTQPNRDFYRIGVGLDVTSILSKAFKSQSP